MKKAPQSANIALGKLFKRAEKLKPKLGLSAEQMDKSIDNEMRAINSKIRKVRS